VDEVKPQSSQKATGIDESEEEVKPVRSDAMLLASNTLGANRLYLRLAQSLGGNYSWAFAVVCRLSFFRKAHLIRSISFSIDD